MPTLENDALVFRFPQIEEWAIFSLSFQRTLRIPDTDKTYALPPSFGRFPVRHVEDYAPRLAAKTVSRGGVILPVWQAEAMWLDFFSFGPAQDLDFPVAVKVAAGKINAVTGEPWRPGLLREPQNYMVSPGQPWLDGFAIAPGVIRQFVAMPLGESYTIESQLTGGEEWGGLQIEVTPLKAHVWQEMQAQHKRARRPEIKPRPVSGPIAYSIPTSEMGVAAGGRMRQGLYPDHFMLDDWDMSASDRVFVSLLHAKDWKSVTGEDAPNPPPTPQDYARAGLPWFDCYGNDQPFLPGGTKLTNIRSVATLFEEKTGATLPNSGDVATGAPKSIGLGSLPRPIRGGNW